jgi:putative transcriptional regulator
VRTNIQVLMAQKAQQDRRRLSPRTLARETGINPYTIYGLINGTLRELPIEAIEKLCAYFGCDIGELLVLVEE